ncbi:Tachykinins [Eumeta japonica]|uniref:Tachykinins n=1 Tax=Eumeta variegata TaxID=151549 RepID=A0A4C1VX77_EUMVA|nr:Tachykinins [Eumeta japonica]
MGSKSRTCLLLISLQIIQSIYTQDLTKRVPQGFMAMRGKKFNEDEYHKRKLPFFMAVKGKKLYDYLQNDPYPYKRAPVGFIGMRGKKDVDLIEPTYQDTSEYVPRRDGSIFGQIDYSTNEEALKDAGDFNLLNRLISEYLQQKEQQLTEGDVENGPNDSKSEEEYPSEHSNELTKRAAQMHQFFGVRGKKTNKRPFDLSFRGRFVGVRGKKDLKNAKEIRLLVDGAGEPWPKRKSQMNGFFGMRGKKWVEGQSRNSQNKLLSFPQPKRSKRNALS